MLRRQDLNASTLEAAEGTPAVWALANALATAGAEMAQPHGPEAAAPRSLPMLLRATSPRGGVGEGRATAPWGPPGAIRRCACPGRTWICERACGREEEKKWDGGVRDGREETKEKRDEVCWPRA